MNAFGGSSTMRLINHRGKAASVTNVRFNQLSPFRDIQTKVVTEKVDGKA
jgi:CDP-diacylglycerol pyrophosphatase